MGTLTILFFLVLSCGPGGPQDFAREKRGLSESTVHGTYALAV
jgi:hypothetical protein